MLKRAMTSIAAAAAVVTYAFPARGAGCPFAVRGWIGKHNTMSAAASTVAPANRSEFTRSDIGFDSTKAQASRAAAGSATSWQKRGHLEWNPNPRRATSEPQAVNEASAGPV